MIQRLLFRVLLAPFALLYGIGVSVRNWLYFRGVLKSVSFDIPVISVGNLTMGGAGKTPHLEYLIRLLKDYIEVATLSRGYMRKTRGFRVVDPSDTVEKVGDEPLQFKRKFRDVLVTVSESRMFGVPQILSLKPDTQVVLLDDAFQHLAVRPGLNILLTEFNRPYTRDFVLPSGRLREWPGASERADVIVVTKCPDGLTHDQAEQMRLELAPLNRQKLFFSRYQYAQPYYLFDRRYTLDLGPGWSAVVMCAIANTAYLQGYLEGVTDAVRMMQFADHHAFTPEDLSALRRTWEGMDSQHKCILTTEKDATRLEAHRDFILEHRLPIFVLPVEVAFLFGGGEAFDEHIRQFLLDFKV